MKISPGFKDENARLQSFNHQWSTDCPLNKTELAKADPFFTEPVLKFCAQILCSDSVLKFCAQILCSNSVLKFCAQILCSNSVLKFCAQILCSNSVPRFSAKILCSNSVLRFCAQILCSDSVPKFCLNSVLKFWCPDQGSVIPAQSYIGSVLGGPDLAGLKF